VTAADGRRVVAVTGGGGGIGAAIAEQLGRQGAFVVTMDPLVTLDGSERLPDAEDATAGRIVAAGGSARATSVSVTDGEGVRALFAELVEEHGRLDGVVNVAGITRPTSYAAGTEEDWAQVLDVHLGGYLNVLHAALPLMAAAGRGRILGVTSGSGWRPADTGAYGCAKRAVASLTWQLGGQAPPGVAVNAVSPIAYTRMVAAALGRPTPAPKPSGDPTPRSGDTSSAKGRSDVARSGSSSKTGGLSLGAMPQPEELGPIGAHLVGDGVDWCRGQVVFAAGSEVALVEPPRLLEVVRTDAGRPLAPVLETLTPACVAAEAAQVGGGGSNARFPGLFAGDAGDAGDAGGDPAGSLAGSCVVVSDRADLSAAVRGALEARGATCREAVPAAPGFMAAQEVLRASADGLGDLGAVVVALRGDAEAIDGTTGGWEQVLAQHEGIVDGLHADAAWSRAVADHAATTGRTVRLVTVTDASDSGGRSRAQAAAQHARAAKGGTDGRVAAFTVADETRVSSDRGPLAEVVAHLVASPEAAGLAGAELAAGAGWFGLRSHPRPGGSITYGGPEVPPWFDEALRGIVGLPPDSSGDEEA